MKYFDIQTPMKKQNGWEKSLLELKRMMACGKLYPYDSHGNNTKK